MAKITLRGPGVQQGTPTLPSAGQVGQVLTGSSRGLRDVAQTVKGISLDILDRRQKALDLDYVTDSNTKAQTELKRIRQNMIQTIEDPKGFSDNYMSEVDKVHNRFLKDAPSEAARRVLKSNFSNQRNALFTNSFNVENKLIADNILSNSIENIDTIALDLVDNPGTYEARKIELKAILESASEVLDPVAEKALREKGEKDLADSYIRGLMKADIKSAEQVVNSDKLDDVLSKGEILKYRSAVEARKEELEREALREISAQKEAAKIDREFGIFNGTVDQLMLDKDLEDGVYGKKEWLQLSRSLESRINKQRSRDLSIKDIETRLEAGTPFDTTNPKVRKSLDIYFENSIRPMLTADNAIDMVSTFVDQFDYIPSQVKGEMLASLHNGSDQAVVRSAKTIDSIVKRDPQLSRQFNSTRDLARARQISNAVVAGLPHDMAVKAADNMLVERNTTEFKMRERNFRDSKKDFDQGELTSIFVNDPNSVPEKMVQDWETLYKELAVDLKMDEESARELSYEIVKGQWSISKATGEPKYVKHAPEIFYNRKGLDPEWIEKQLRNDISSVASDIEDYDIQAHPDTLGTSNPGYIVNYISPEGVPLMLRDEDGDLLVWRPDIENSEDAKMQMQKAEEKFSKKRLEKVEPKEVK